MRSREEAEKLAQTLHGYQQVKDGTVAPEIDEAVIGSMGTFYRVRLGPFASVGEADAVLSRVISSGQPEARIVVD